MMTATIEEILAAFAAMDPQVREGVWRVVSAVIGGGTLADVVKEAEIAITMVAALKVEDSLPGSAGRI